MTPTDDTTAVRRHLAAANPIPEPMLADHELAAAEASVGASRPSRPVARSPRRVWAVAASMVVVGALLVAAVIVSDRDDRAPTILATGTGGKAVAAAYAATQKAGTARGSVTVARDGAAPIVASGVTDFDAGTAQWTLATPDGGTIQLVSTTDAVYLQLPAEATRFTGGKPWVKADRTALERVAQMVLGPAAPTANPADALEFLRAVSGNVETVGPDTTRGEPTTHYRAQIDPAKITPTLAGRIDAADLGQTVPTDVWVDAAGRLRKLTLAAPSEVGAGAAQGSSAGPMTVTFELWDFGTEVAVTAPPADQVSDAGGMLGLLGGGTHNP
jgi:hypothetical protein